MLKKNIKLKDKENTNQTNIWGEIRSNFENEGIINIDAWLTEDENEEGNVIAKVNTKTLEVEYLDDRAKTDNYAQEMINEVLGIE